MPHFYDVEVLHRGRGDIQRGETILRTRAVKDEGAGHGVAQEALQLGMVTAHVAHEQPTVHPL
jgi:hypothetical protein